MKVIFRIAFAVALSCLLSSAQTKISRSDQVNGPALSGNGAPSVTCTSANYGEFYTAVRQSESKVGWEMCDSAPRSSEPLSTEQAVEAPQPAIATHYSFGLVPAH